MKPFIQLSDSLCVHRLVLDNRFNKVVYQLLLINGILQQRATSRESEDLMS